MDTREAAKRWAETWERGWRTQEAEAIVALYAEDAHFQSHPFRQAQAPRDYIEPTLADEASAECEFREPIVDGDRATVEWSAETKLKDAAARSSPASPSCGSMRTVSWSSSETSGRPCRSRG